MGAVERLNADFGLNIPLHRKPTQAETQAAQRRQEVAEAHKLFEAWRSDFIGRLNAAYRVGHLALQGIETVEDLDKLTPAQVEAIRWQPAFEYWADLLSYGSMDEQMTIFRERQVIQSRAERILNRTPTKSGAA